VDEARRFWKDNVLTKVAPANSAPSPETFKKLRREPKSIVQIDAGTVEQWQARRADRLEAEKLEKESYGQIMAALGTAECGELPDGGRVTFLEQRGAPVTDVKGLRADLPEVAAKYVRENSFRVLRFKEAK
jgi:predicted phage-related endonuclease